MVCSLFRFLFFVQSFLSGWIGGSGTDLAALQFPRLQINLDFQSTSKLNYMAAQRSDSVGSSCLSLLKWHIFICSALQLHNLSDRILRSFLFQQPPRFGDVKKWRKT